VLIAVKDMTLFDQRDAEYMSSLLTISQIKREIDRCNIVIEIRDAGCGMEPLPDSWLAWILYQIGRDWKYFTSFPWDTWRDCCRQALQMKKATAPTYAPGPEHTKVDVSKLKEHINIVDLISEYTTVRKSGSRFTAVCPLHEDNHPSLVIYPETQSWHCFQCSAGGDAIEFIQRIQHTDFVHAISILGSK
jgi:hypothetical protein